MDTSPDGASPLHIVGRFPPPFDGQALATRRLAGLLEGSWTVRRHDTAAPEDERVVAGAAGDPRRVAHYLRLRRRLHDALADAPDAPVLWPSISPRPVGHLRDLLTVLPALGTRPTFAVVHWGNFDRLFRSPLTALTARRLAQRLRAFVFLSDTLAERCAPWLPPEKRPAIPNTIDDDVVPADAEVAAKQAAYAEDRPFRLLFLSNMIPSKGYETVLRAVAVLVGRGVPVQATFAGRWPSEAARYAFEALRAELGVGAAATHLGSVRDRATIRRLYLDADAFALPTVYPTEAAPLTITEALSAGTPVLVTAHAGIPAMVREGREASFVPPRAPEALAHAVEALRPLAVWRRASADARARFASTFHRDVVRARWEALLDSTAGP